MPYAPHVRATAIGTLGEGAAKEIFSYSLNLEFANSGWEFIPRSDMDGVADDFRLFHGSPEAGISTLAKLTEVKFAPIGIDGKYTDDPYIVNVADTIGGGATLTGGDNRVAPQLALAASLVTDRRGPTGKGRFYMPMPTTIVQPDLLISSTDADRVATAVQTFLNNVNNQAGLDSFGQATVVVASSKGYNTPVTGVRVGRVVDTIRSRRGALNESYTAVLPVA